MCIYHLLGRCRFADDKCNYSHEKSALPTEGWWTTEAGRRKTSLSMKRKARKVGKKIRGTKGRKKYNHKDTFTSLLALKSIGLGSLYDALFEEETNDIDRRAAGLFTEEEEDELMCQGVKPWDSDAAVSLPSIRGHLFVLQISHRMSWESFMVTMIMMTNIIDFGSPVRILPFLVPV